MIARMLVAATLGVACMVAGLGCSRGEADGAYYYGYTGSQPAVCASCED